MVSYEIHFPQISAKLKLFSDEDKIANLGPLEGNNFCRNPDGDTAPWCIAPNGEFDYCDIPKCGDQAAGGGGISLPVSAPC